MFLMCEEISVTGDLQKNGYETAQGKFLKKFFETYDRIKSTALHRQYEKELEDIRRNNGTQVNWRNLTELPQDISRTGYSAVLKWVITSLDDIQDAIPTSECATLLDLADEAYEWRQNDAHRHEGGADDGHRHAQKLWDDVRNKVEEVKVRKFCAANNNFEDYKRLFK